MNILWIKRLATAVILVAAALTASAQKYSEGLIDKTIAIVGNEVIMLSDLEEEVAMMKAYGMMSDKKGRCEILEEMMATKLFLMQARLDSLAVNSDMVEGELSNRLDMLKTNLGGEEEVAKQFGKPIYKLRQEWRQTLEDQTLTQQMQQEIAGKVPELSPYDVQKYVEATDVAANKKVGWYDNKADVVVTMYSIYGGDKEVFKANVAKEKNASFFMMYTLIFTCFLLPDSC